TAGRRRRDHRGHNTPAVRGILMPDTLLAVLKLCFLAVLYLFFLRAIRVVWAAMSPTPVVAAPVAPRATARQARKPAGAAPLRRGDRIQIGKAVLELAK